MTSEQGEKKAEIDHVEDSEANFNNSGIANAFREEGIAELQLEDVLPKLEKPWYKYSYLLKLNFLLVFSMMSSTNTGFDGSMLNGLQSIPSWSPYFGGLSGWRLGIISCAGGFGGIVGSLVGNYLADKIGRRYPTVIGCIFVIIGVIVQASAQNYAAFFIGRFIMGFGMVLCNVVGPLAISELAYPTHRPILTSCFNILFYAGSTLASLATLGCYHIPGLSNWSWRGPSLLQCFFPILQLMMFWWVPESPRFLISKGRFEEARDVLGEFHAGGDRNARLVEFEMAQITIALDNERALQSVSFKEFFATRQNLHRLFVISFLACMQQLSGNALVSYYLVLVLESIGITSANQQLTINVGLNVYNLGVAILILFLIERFRRRQMFMACTIGMLLTYVIWTVLSAINQKRNFEDKSLGKGVLAMIFLYFFAYDLGLLGLPYLYYTEVLPYFLRSKGMFIVQCWQQLIGVFNGLVNSIAMDAIEWKYYIVYCCIIGVEVFVVYLFFPETKGYTLETAAEAFGDTVVTEKDHPKAVRASDDADDASEVSA
ncbi:unnamed protein product [Kuraishia capsulata CBS 1993]|uniref:Major facilitator superfamily (MFS) profile domain-containing protein n=1 Tax=Kuraishia capsulata CBS 1993 TaxID=1382522 RepID=W6MMR4_9ASCO|nr:uncharacterized protein KUCA_T00002238001 [Kuraishia capsulata CBS 1993]CDK26267.1 unnamed protein product [Kuraishia capsulata CBS 1993]